MREQTALLTLGRLPKALALARALHAGGWRVVVADPFRWHLCRPSRAVSASYRVTAPNKDRDSYRRELADIIRRERVTTVFPVSEEALHVAYIADALPGESRLFCPTFDTLLHLHDKLAFATLAQSQGLSVPPTFPAASEAGRELCSRNDAIAKPAHSCSGIGIQRLQQGQRPSGDAPDLLVQRFIEGNAISTLSLLRNGREVGRSRYRGTVFAGTVAVCFERVDVHAAIDAWLDAFFRANPMENGFIAFDFIVDADGCAWAIECNPRVTSGIHFFDPVSLGMALTAAAGATAADVSAATGRRYQWAYSTLTEAYGALFQPAEFRRRLRELRRARDVVWSRDDPLPFLLMTPLSAEILWPAMTSTLTLGEATQRDIAWFN
ncbi:ATP-grasp domain-containing protein [Chromatocurvus halotolerans]|uniref:ATP-grasp domain-containing protein n=1 Tax=Chromatocurvus halotolerans TaxID=1132028 RepID=A0A4R2L023_9GAMM|nr:ATP-grasp domain-containing protein [Chromatocurvus halotolerans]TCO77079.1 ATP-grasp domain-containing protein [Chromatocurvus halotolerans]